MKKLVMILFVCVLMSGCSTSSTTTTTCTMSEDIATTKWIITTQDDVIVAHENVSSIQREGISDDQFEATVETTESAVEGVKGIQVSHTLDEELFELRVKIDYSEMDEQDKETYTVYGKNSLEEAIKELETYGFECGE